MSYVLMGVVLVSIFIGACPGCNSATCARGTAVAAPALVGIVLCYWMLHFGRSVSSFFGLMSFFCSQVPFSWFALLVVSEGCK